MKKLMMAAAVVCAVASVQAGAIKWSSTGMGVSGTLYAAGDSTKTQYAAGDSITAYLFDAAVISQQALFDGIANNTYADLSKATSLDNTDLASNSKIAAKTTAELSKSGQEVTVYWALLDEGNIYFSTTKTVGVPTAELSTVNASWSDTQTLSKNAINKSGSVSGGGWYAVPEPTSAMLLLLGMAGLALRRKRA